MADGHGGYRRPSNPAPVSGPGKLSRRTDTHQPVRTMPGGDYGDGVAQVQAQQAAPLAASSNVVTPTQAQAVTAQMPTPLHAPSENPNQPVTAGADAGAGPGSSVLNLPTDSRDSLRAQYGPIMPALVAQAQSPYATQAFKDSVRAILAMM